MIRSMNPMPITASAPFTLADIEDISTAELMVYMLNRVPLREAVEDVRRKRALRAAGLDFGPGILHRSDQMIEAFPQGRVAAPD